MREGESVVSEARSRSFISSSATPLLTFKPNYQRQTLQAARSDSGACVIGHLATASMRLLPVTVQSKSLGTLHLGWNDASGSGQEQDHSSCNHNCIWRERIAKHQHYTINKTHEKSPFFFFFFATDNFVFRKEQGVRCSPSVGRSPCKPVEPTTRPLFRPGLQKSLFK